MRTQFNYRVTGLLVGLLALQGCQQDTEVSERKPVTVTALEVSVPIESQYRNFKGSVAPADLTPLSFRVDGKLDAILVRKGQSIKKGQLLAKLDSSKLRQILADAQAQYELAVKQHSRGKELLKIKMVSQSEYDELKANMRIALVNFQIAKNNLEYTRLIAPFDGFVSEVPKESYENASTGEEVLSVYRGDVVRIKVATSDSVLAMINPDQEKRDYETITTFFGNEKEYISKYYQHSSEPEEGSNSFAMWLEMPQVEPPILPGTSANLHVDMVAAGLRVVQGYELPMTSLDAGELKNEFFIWKLTGNVVNRIPVQVLKITTSGALVASGVSDGDIIVNSNLRKMREGAVVAIVNKETK